jgi:hypothetical protein
MREADRLNYRGKVVDGVKEWGQGAVACTVNKLQT